MIERLPYRLKSGRLALILIERKPPRMIRRARARAKAARQRWRVAAE